MLEIIKTKDEIEDYFKVLNKRGSVNSGDYSDTVKKIVSDIAKNGDKALEEYTRKFDDPNFKISDIEVSK